MLELEALAVKDIGAALLELCKDADYKAAMSDFKKVIYQPVADSNISVVAEIKGSTITLKNYIFGGTRVAWDYETALKSAL